MTKLHTLLAAVAVLACGAPALAGEVTLRPNPLDADGRASMAVNPASGRISWQSAA